jgi:acetate---CoA ligase (ADP-forming)
VPTELERCGRAGIKAAMILSSGFAEEGEAGARMQDEMSVIARRYDMAVSGPNSEGFANIPAAFCPTFSPALDKNAGPIKPARALGAGQVSVISQSGGLGFAVFDRARPRNLAFRHIVTTGNEAALEALDFVDYMLDEGMTNVFLLLLEDVKSPEKFKRVAEKALRAGKPIIVGKIGRSEAGARAVASHTAALAGSEASYRAVFYHYGLIEARELDDMIDFAVGFLACGDRMPAGKRIGICTASGGAGVWMADACVAAGLEVPVLDEATRKSIDVHIPSYGSSQNPVDCTAQGVHKLGYATFANLLAQSPLIDGITVVVTARRSAFLEIDLPKLENLKNDTRKPIYMWTYTLPSDRSVEILNAVVYPLFTSAFGCARTIRAMGDYCASRERILNKPRATCTPHPAYEKVHAVLAGATVLSEYHARSLLELYGIGGSAGVLARSAAEAETAARISGRTVALKVQSADIPHKTEAGAVALNVRPEDARAAYERVLENAKRFAPTAQIEGVLVQAMTPAGREMIVGISRDECWGPLLMLGLGGVMVEAVRDAALAPVPLDHEAVLTLIHRLKASAVFGSYRGMPPADIEALADLMVKLSQFAFDHANDVAEVDLNPVIVHGKGDGVTVVDALIVKRAVQRAQRRTAAE